MRNPPPEPAPAPGMLSNVLSFVTREVESFVTTAIGGSDAKDQTRPHASTSRVRLDGAAQDGRRRRKEGVKRRAEVDDEREFARRRNSTPRGVSDFDEEAPRTRRPRKKTPSKHNTPSPMPARIRRVASNGQNGSSTQEYAIPLSGSPGSRSPSPTPPPIPPLLKPRKVMTMPGSLFPRSESLIPESPPTPEQPVRRVSWLPRTPSPPLSARRRAEGHLSAVEKSEKAKGKERACDTSGEVRVRGKERELRAAREAHARDEPDRGDEERERDKQRIRMLELEVARLRAQLAARKDGSSHLPPPPPPPPVSTGVTFRPPAMPTVALADSFLASARASLKPTTPPVEAPINIVTGRTRRAGQPTVNVPSDKMAAFLNEMKTVRLRKVSSGADDSRAMPPPRYVPGERSFSAVEGRLGEKRKRDAIFMDMTSGPSKKQNTTIILPDHVTGSSASLSSQSSQTSANSSLMFPPPDHIPPRGWPSVATTETDITTPSLCSDNENDHEQVDERLPQTPPHNRTHHSSAARAKQRKPDSTGQEIDVPAARSRTAEHRTDAPEKEKTPPHIDFFARRPPRSPMPPAPVRRVKAPARKRPLVPSAPALDLNVSDGDDPLSMSAPERGRPGATPHPVKQKRSAHKSRPCASSSASREASVSSVRASAQPQQAASSQARRRRTLDDELRRAGDQLWDTENLSEDELQVGIESGELVGVGTQSKNQGFLKGGGAAGKPVFMEMGHVQGAENDGDDEDEGEDPPLCTVQRRRRKPGKSTERT